MTINTSKSISHLLLDLEFVLILPVEVYHLVTEPGFIHCFLEVRKGGEEHIVIAILRLSDCYFRQQKEYLLIVNRNRDVRFDQLHQLDALLRIHGNHQQWHLRRRNSRSS